MKKFHFLIFTMWFLLIQPVIAAEKTYTFAVVPQQAASEMAQIWIPFLQWLSERSGIKLKFVTAPDIPAFEKRLSQGNYDFAYMNPYHYTIFHAKPGYQALAKEKDRKIRGIIVVRKDSSINDIKDLNGSTIIFPSQFSFAASILPQATLHKEAITFQSVFASSHDSVYLNVLHGKFPAGGGIVRTFDMLDDSTKNELRILWTTPAFTPHAIASHPNLPKIVSNKVLDAMVIMNEDTEGLKKLKAIGFTGVMAAQDADWNDVRALNIRDLGNVNK